MLVMKRPTRHGAESNDNLISDEINVNLSRASRLSKKPNQQTRNNNYFTGEGKQKKSLAAKSDKKVDDNYLNIDSDEDEDFIVGKVDDAEEFKLGKIN